MRRSRQHEYFRCDRCDWYGHETVDIESRHTSEFWGMRATVREYENGCPECGSTDLVDARRPCDRCDDAEAIEGSDQCAPCTEYLETHPE